MRRHIHYNSDGTIFLETDGKQITITNDDLAEDKIAEFFGTGTVKQRLKRLFGQKLLND